LIAIRWADVDINGRIVRVQRAIVRRKVKVTTKTTTVRDVYLDDRALAAFEAQRRHTILAERGELHPSMRKTRSFIQLPL
jgi:integrase